MSKTNNNGSFVWWIIAGVALFVLSVTVYFLSSEEVPALLLTITATVCDFHGNKLLMKEVSKELEENEDGEQIN